MYNRYIRNDRGIYTRITEEDGGARGPENGPPHESPPETHGPPSETSGPQSDGPPHGRPPELSEPPRNPPQSPEPPRNPYGPPHGRPPELSGPPPHVPPSGLSNHDPLSGFLRRFIGPSPLDRFDADDLLLLGLLFLLYREGADEETVLALGLLLLL